MVEPLLAGAVHDKVTCPDVPVAVAATLVGVPGTVPGVTEFDAADDAPFPQLLVAWTSKV